MPVRDWSCKVYLGSIEDQDSTPFGRKYTWALSKTIWAELVSLNTSAVNMQGINSNTAEFKVILMTPATEYNLEKTRFILKKRGREFILQPYYSEFRGETRVDKSVYHCRQIPAFV
jgi:cellobiose-specific phosphotransferase system component IIB